MVTVHFVELSLLSVGPISSMPSLCEAPCTAQQRPDASNSGSHVGVPVMPEVRWPAELKFATRYWSVPGSPCSPEQSTAGSKPRLHRAHWVPPSAGVALVPLT